MAYGKAKGSNPLRELNVLVADEDAFMARILGDILRALGVHTISVADSFADARMLLQRMEVGLLITDWVYSPDRPGGWSLIDEVRQSKGRPKPDLPIILCTAYTELPRIIEGRDKGVTEIIAKPIAPVQVLHKITSAIYRQRPFIVSGGFTGPDRRRHRHDWASLERRSGKMLEQSEIDAVMAPQRGSAQVS